MKASKDKGSKIPEVNIGLVGHVDHGKTTLNMALTGKWTDTHSEELKRGITIRLGYADASFPSRTVSFVDAPGHETLMATVLSGSALMDGALLVIAANEPCPQPQTAEHLAVLDIVGIKNIVIVQNKIDLVSEEQALKHYEQIKAFVKGTVAENAPIVPVSAQHRAGLDVLIETVENTIKTPKRELTKDPKMYVARSFDVNKPGAPIEKLIGGVVGGGLVEGKLKIGDEIELRPGLRKVQGGQWEAIKTKIVSMVYGSVQVKEGTPGGLLALGTLLDPYITKADSLVGNVVGLPGKLPPVWNELKLEMHLLTRVVGLEEKEKAQIKLPIKGEQLMMNVGTARTVGICEEPGKISKFKLKMPVCASVGDKVAISKLIFGRWRLIGWGVIK